MSPPVSLDMIYMSQAISWVKGFSFANVNSTADLTRVFLKPKRHVKSKRLLFSKCR